MVAVIGEALIDLVEQARTADGPPTSTPFLAHPGGSPLNVAIGLARLGQHTHFFGRFGQDAFGRQLKSYALVNGLDLSLAVDASQPSTLAVVGLDSAGAASYDFYVEGTADWQWTAAELGHLAPVADWVHTGSLASWLTPSADAIARALRGLPTNAVISFDPNVRPRLMPERHSAVDRIENLIALANVVKASEEDIAWLYPGQHLDAVLDQWAAAGPALIVATLGPNGAVARAGGRAFVLPGRPVDVVDTVGAGDSFMAALINALIRSNSAPSDLAPNQITAVIAEAIVASSLTCQRAGADPPTAAQLTAALKPIP